jgi:hypothetical protein
MMISSRGCRAMVSFEAPINEDLTATDDSHIGFISSSSAVIDSVGPGGQPPQKEKQTPPTDQW